jgi:hypothetical protein
MWTSESLSWQVVSGPIEGRNHGNEDPTRFDLHRRTFASSEGTQDKHIVRHTPERIGEINMNHAQILTVQSRVVDHFPYPNGMFHLPCLSLNESILTPGQYLKLVTRMLVLNTLSHHRRR